MHATPNGMHAVAERKARTPFYAEVSRTHEAAGRAIEVLAEKIMYPLANLVAEYVRTDPRVIETLFDCTPHAMVYAIADGNELLFIDTNRAAGQGPKPESGQYQYEMTLSHIRCEEEIDNEDLSRAQTSLISVTSISAEELWRSFLAGDELADKIEAEPEICSDKATEEFKMGCGPYKRRVVMELIGSVHQFACGDITYL